MLWGAPALGAAAVCTFSTPDLDGSAKVFYAYASYTLLMVMYTVVNVPYSALMGVMTDNSAVRTTLSSFRFVGAFVCALFVQTFTMDLVKIFGAGDDGRGWQLTMILYAVLATVLFWVSFATTRERIEPPKKQVPNVKEDGRALLANGPWLVLFFLGVFVIIAFWMRGGTTAYYFKYYVGDETQVGTFFFWAGIATLAGIFITSPLSKIFGKRNLYRGLMGLAGLLTCAFYVVDPDDIAAMYTLNILAAFLLGPTAPLVFAMYADTADFAEWKSGRRLTGLVFAGAMFGMKVGSAVAGWVMGMTLSWVGYAANETQTPEALHGIVLMMSLFPGVICIAAAILVGFYRLDQPTMEKIEVELKARRAAA
jgi:GPH family glycoside/pentoside/hexuronide:cation symporter